MFITTFCTDVPPAVYNAEHAGGFAHLPPDHSLSYKLHCADNRQHEVRSCHSRLQEAMAVNDTDNKWTVVIAVLSESEAKMAWEAMQDMLAQCIGQLKTSSGICYSMHACSIQRHCILCCGLLL